MPLKFLKLQDRLEKIMTDPESAFRYCLKVLGKRWPEAEPYILKDPEVARLYAAAMFPGERWPQLEKIIINDPKMAYRYAYLNLDKRWPEAEPIIMKDAGIAYYYAMDVIKGPWPEAEPYIMKNARWAPRYARDSPYIKNADIRS
jgi:hypothetical protein